jgi:hypothetical protein
MVRHEHVRMHGTVFPCGQLTQSLQVTEVVRFTKEAWLAIVAPLDHVLGDTRDVQARLACDGEAPVKGVSQYHEVAAWPFSGLQYLGSENCTLVS